MGVIVIIIITVINQAILAQHRTLQLLLSERATSSPSTLVTYNRASLTNHFSILHLSFLFSCLLPSCPTFPPPPTKTHELLPAVPTPPTTKLTKYQKRKPDTPNKLCLCVLLSFIAFVHTGFIGISVQSPHQPQAFRNPEERSEKKSLFSKKRNTARISRTHQHQFHCSL